VAGVAAIIGCVTLTACGAAGHPSADAVAASSSTADGAGDDLELAGDVENDPLGRPDSHHHFATQTC
jgi:hypothetical protein